MSGTAQETQAGRIFRAISRPTAAGFMLAAALLSAQAPAAQAPADQAPADQASLAHAPSVSAATPASQPRQADSHHAAKHYYYVTAFDSGLRGRVGPNTVHVQFYAKTGHLISKSDHSLTEIYTRDAAGNAVELGVTTDTFWLPNSKPHFFVSSWTAGQWNGYDTNAGFVSTSSSATPGATEPPLNKYTEYGYKYSKGRMWISYNNVYVGYFPASVWAGGWRTAIESQTYAEVYASNTASRALPSMNGSVRRYATSTKSHFTDFTISSPYKIHHAKSHSFGFSCQAGCHK